MAVLEDAIREILCLSAELLDRIEAAGAATLGGRLDVADADLGPEPEARGGVDRGRRADECQPFRRCRRVAGGELREPLRREAQRDGDGIVKREASACRVRADRMNGDRLLTEQVAHRVQRVDAQVGHRTAPIAVLPPRVRFVHVLREGRAEGPELAECALAGAGDHLDGAGLMMQPVGDHQLRATRFLGRQDLLAFGEAGGHRLFQQHVNARFECRHRVLGVQEVRCGDVDRVDLAGGQQRAILLVAVGLETVQAGELVSFDRVAGHQRHHLRIVRARDTRHERLLRDLPAADHRVAHLLPVSEHGAFPRMAAQRSPAARVADRLRHGE